MSAPTLPISVPAKKVHASFVSHAKLIGVLTLLSRILGQARETVAASYFGAGPVWSAFTVAFKVPNLFRKLLGEGALSAAFIPLYTQSLRNDSAKRANDFAAASVTLLTVILVGLTVAGELFLWVFAAFVPLRPDNVLVVRFTAIMLPYVLLICLTAFLGAILQVHKRFGLPAFTPVLLNVIHIGVIMIGARLLWLRHAVGEEQRAIQTTLANWLAIFVLIAGVLQVAMLVPTLRAVGFRFRWMTHFWTPAIKKMLKLSVPIALCAGVLQISVLVDTGITLWLTRGVDPSRHLHLFGQVFAYPMATGAVARLNWAQFLYQFPLGVFAISLATAIFPDLSADALDSDRLRFRGALRHGITATLMEGLPASVGLIIVRYPTIRLLFQHGSFTADDTRWVALSTVFYGAAIWAFSLQQILNKAYYSLHDMMTPLILSVVTIVVNTVVEIPLVFTHLGEAGMAAGTAASFGLQAIVMLIILERRVGSLGMRDMSIAAGKMLVGCGAMALACWAVQKMPMYPRGAGSLAALAQLVILMSVGAAAYLLTCRLAGLSPREILFPRQGKTATP